MKVKRILEKIINEKFGIELAIRNIECNITIECNKTMTYEAFSSEATEEDDHKGVAGSNCGGGT